MTINNNNKGTWEEQKERLKKRFPRLTDDDLEFDDEVGKKEEMLAGLQIKLGKSKEELRKIIEGE